MQAVRNALAGCTALTLFPNPADGALAQIRGDDGTTFAYFGTKDINGVPLSVSQIVSGATSSDSSHSTSVFFDPQGRPTRAMTPDATVTIEWVSASRAVVSVVTNDGKEFRQAFDINDTGTAARSVAGGDGWVANAMPESRPANSLTGAAAALCPVPAPGVCPNRSGKQGFPGVVQVSCGDQLLPASSGTTVVGFVHVASLGVPIGDPHALQFAESAVVPGCFNYCIPDRPAPLDSTAECTSFTDTMKTFCESNKKERGLLGVSCVLALPSCPFVLRAVATVEAACKFFADDSIPDLCRGLGAVADVFLQDVLKDRAEVNLQVRNLHFGPPKNAQLTLLPDSPVPLTVVELGSPTIVFIRTVPSDPAPTEGYTIVADLACVSAGTQIVVSVDGTDGYRGSAIVTVASGQTEVAASVEGADQPGVVDTITVRLQGTDETLTATIVF